MEVQDKGTDTRQKAIANLMTLIQNGSGQPASSSVVVPSVSLEGGRGGEENIKSAKSNKYDLLQMIMTSKVENTSVEASVSHSNDKKARMDLLQGHEGTLKGTEKLSNKQNSNDSDNSRQEILREILNTTRNEYHGDKGTKHRSPVPLQQSAVKVRGGAKMSSSDKKMKKEIELRIGESQSLTFRPRVAVPQLRLTKVQEVPFIKRSMVWHERKMRERERKREQSLWDSMQDCTFAPEIYQLPDDEGQTKVVTGMASDIVDKLYKQDTMVASKKSRMVEEKAAQDEEDFKRECTFKPTTNHASKEHDVFGHVKPKYLSSQGSSKKVGLSEEVTRELTFIPKVNSVSKSMKKAKEYTSRQVFSRLSQMHQPKTIHASVDDIHIRYNYKPYNGGSSGPQNGQHPLVKDDNFHEWLSEALTSKPKKNSIDRSSGKSKDDGDLKSIDKVQEAAFAKFLDRLHRFHVKKNKHLENLQHQYSDTFKPTIFTANTPEAQKLSVPFNDKVEGSCYDRFSQYAMKKETDLLKSKVLALQDFECTFKPTLTSKSKTQPFRSHGEMSHGDWSRKRNKEMAFKMAADKKEMEQCTFEPRLNDNRSSQGKLNITKDSTTYVYRVKLRSNAVHNPHMRKTVVDKELEETMECTFAPEIHTAPSFVRRIAAERATAKGRLLISEESPTPPKPKWSSSMS